MNTENNLPNQEIIDATQDAVLNAVGNVANVIESTAHELGAHEVEPFYQSGHFWVAVSFVLAVVLLIRPVTKIMHKMLRRRGAVISRRINDAAEVYEQAQKMLAEYELKFRNAGKEAADILNRSEREIAVLRKDKIAKLESDMINREREALARIEASQDEATKEIVEKASSLAMATVKKALTENMTAQKQDKLIDASIDAILKL